MKFERRMSGNKMKIFISGGCKNGKSSLAQELAVFLRDAGPLYYLATMISADKEDDRRIARHVADREGLGFTTLEQGRHIRDCLNRADRNGTFLLDSVTALLSNEMFHDGTFDDKAAERTAEDLLEFCEEARNVILVSDFIYSDAALYDELTEQYRKGLALVDRTLAGACDTVVEVCEGSARVHKGELPL